MKRFALLCGAFFLATHLALAADSREITSAEAKNLLLKNKQIFLLDVRTPDEYRQARIKGATLIPVDELRRRDGEVPKNRPVLVYCASGSRSRMAAVMLKKQGVRDVYNMSDGLVGWYRNGFPLDK